MSPTSLKEEVVRRVDDGVVQAVALAFEDERRACGTRPKCLAAVVTGDSPTGTSSRAVVVRHFRLRVRVDIVYSALY